MLEHGAYRLLLDYYYTNEGPIPTDLLALFRVCRAHNPRERAAVEKMLSKYFHAMDGVWIHDRADEEIKKTNEISEERRKAANKKHANAEQLHTQPTTYNHNQGNYKNGGSDGRPKTGAEAAARAAEKFRSENTELDH
jgi:uncharacterized protein YdaU (DUF1376 family)